MKRICLLLTFLLFSSHSVYSADNESTYYISPGIGISWDFKSNLFLGLKVSFGRMVNEERYYNVTVGKKYLVIKNPSPANDSYYHFDVQAGSFLDRYPFSAGIGVGVALFNDKTMYPRLS